MRLIISIFISLSVLAAAMPLSVAQDVRQRTDVTIVQDALAQLPASSAEALEKEMEDLALSAPGSVGILAGMMVPASEGQNSKVEYAINGLVNYACSHEEGKYSEAVRQGLASAIEKCTDLPNRVFLLTQFGLLAQKDDVPVLLKYVQDEGTASVALGILTSIEGSEDAIMELVRTGGASRPLLADAVAVKGIGAAEPYILEWMEQLDGDRTADSDPSSKSDTPDFRSYCHALACCGTEASANVLLKNSVYDYMTLLGRLAGNGNEKAALARAKKMLKSGDVHIRCSALEIVLGIEGRNAMKYLMSALRSSDRDYRCAALGYAAAFADDTVYEEVAEAASKLGSVVLADVITWFGDRKAVSQLGFVIGNMSSQDEVTALAAICAAGKIGGDEAADALVSALELSPERADAACRALLSFDGDITDRIAEVLSGEGDSREYALRIATMRRMGSLAPQVFSLVDDSDPEIAASACRALCSIATVEDASRINVLLTDGRHENRKEYLQKALCKSLEALSPEHQYETVVSMMQAGGASHLYYPVLAQAGSCIKAVELLKKEYDEGASKEEAFAALLSVEDWNAGDVLFSIAKVDPADSEAALDRYVTLVAQSGHNASSKIQRYASVMALEPSPAVRNNVLRYLQYIPSMQSFLLASKYLDDPQTSYMAAAAVKSVASGTEDEIDYYALKTALEKAADIYAAAGGADDGYAVDEIRKMLAGLQPPAEKFVLPEDEAKAGYEVLFDGTDLSQWVGDTTGYTPVNGTIYVTAGYGNAKNLYTRKEYRDFIFRFEFCFVKPGVNNGVGIRTPMGKDAAYWGMCEVQILDHDDPIYKGLKEYQVHGSAYGIIPAKRVVHKPLGEWNTEEIKVVGDRVTVTLNGEVILDGNLRKACKGHNVAPDGGDKNPYTADHRNHPGMFNEKGHVGFLGHGEGIRFRNVRILDLNK